MDDYDFYEDDFEVEEASGESSRRVSQNFLTPKHQEKPKKIVAVSSKKKGLPVSKTQDLSPHSRLISSKDHEIRGLRNQLTLLQNQLKDSIKENRLIKRLQVKYERELNTITKQEGELPNILQKHSEEVRALRTQLHRSQLNNSDLQKRIQEMSNEMLKTQDRVKKLDELAKKRNLPAREQLVFQLQELKEHYQKSEQRALKLEYSLELAQKAHGQEVKQLLSKNRTLFQQLEGLKEENKVTRWQLKERERLLDVTNIYTQRVQPTSTNLPPLPMTDNVMTQTTLTHPPFSEAILKTKPITITNECQTDSAWLTEILSSKNQIPAAADNKNTKPGAFTQGGFTPVLPGLTPGIQRFGPAPGPTSTVVPNITSTTQGPTPIIQLQQSTGTVTGSTLGPISQRGSFTPVVQGPVATVPGPTSTVQQSTKVELTPAPLTNPQTVQQSTTSDLPSLIPPPSIVPTASSVQNNKDITRTNNDTISELLGLRPTNTSPQPLLPNLKSTPPQSTSPLTPTPLTPSPVQSIDSQSLLPEEKPQQPVNKSDEVKKLLFGNHSSSLTSTKTNTVKAPLIATDTGKTTIAGQEKRELLDKLFPKKSESNGSSICTNTTTSTLHTSTTPTITTTTTTIGPLKQHELSATNNKTTSTNLSRRHILLQEDLTLPPSSDNDLLKRLFPTQSKPTSSSSTPVAKDTSSTSNVSWPERIDNLHHGLPALSTDNEHYGTRRSSLIRDSHSSKLSNVNLTTKDRSNGEHKTGGGSNVRYGRRAPLETKPIFGDTETEEVKGLNPTFGGSTQSDHTYPWEIPIETSRRGVGRLGVTNSNHSVPPPPDDDIEEIVI